MDRGHEHVQRHWIQSQRELERGIGLQVASNEFDDQEGQKDGIFDGPAQETGLHGHYVPLATVANLGAAVIVVVVVLMLVVVIVVVDLTGFERGLLPPILEHLTLVLKEVDEREDVASELKTVEEK